jgi:hypothetical protein
VIAVDRQGNRSEPLSGEFTTLATGSNDLKENNVAVYPNPFNDEIVLTGITELPLQIEVFNSQGQLKLKKKIENIPQSRIDLSFLNRGMYILRIRQQREVTEFKIVKN